MLQRNGCCSVLSARITLALLLYSAKFTPCCQLFWPDISHKIFMILADPFTLWSPRAWKDYTCTCCCEALWIPCGRGILFEFGWIVHKYDCMSSRKMFFHSVRQTLEYGHYLPYNISIVQFVFEHFLFFVSYT